MKPPTRIAMQSAIRQQFHPTYPTPATLPLITRQRRQHIHTTPTAPATVSPIHGTGPPPEPPVPAADSASSRLERRRKQAELLEKAQEIRQSDSKAKSSTSSTSSAAKKTRDSALLRKRFWKDVHVKEVDGAWEVHLDKRPLRRPNTKEIVRVPLSKPLLATALAIEWDMLVSAQQATRQHLIPLTSLVCRALDIADDDNAAAGGESIREGLARMLIRYLDTDSLLCWAPPAEPHEREGEGGDTLRDRQKRAAEEVVGYLTSRVWPGVTIEPVLDGESIVPRSHPDMTRQIVQGWIAGLSAWELAGLERGVLAGKGLLGAVRLLVEWSEGPVGVSSQDRNGEEKRFGVEEAARLASIEVDWQTGRWGEVEDTHDVEKEDLRRQLGSVVLLVTGTGRK
ncbi:ATP12-domain-containing protein [Daldinia eschscholtzii]|nr:ATP12-domain-containing protein [Daldinia eschscholtzii]